MKEKFWDVMFYGSITGYLLLVFKLEGARAFSVFIILWILTSLLYLSLGESPNTVDEKEKKKTMESFISETLFIVTILTLPVVLAAKLFAFLSSLPN